MVAKRKRGGGAFGGKGFADTDGKQEPGTFHKFDRDAKAASLGSKTSSNGFAAGGASKRKDGGAVSGGSSAPSLAKRARGGRTGGSPFSAAMSPSDRQGSSSSGHEGE